MRSVVVVITPPTVPLVSVDEARRHLRVDHAADDTFITSLVETVRSWLDAPAGWLGRALLKQTLELRFDGFVGCHEMPLPFPPTISIASVKYDDTDGVEQTLDPLSYRMVGGGVGKSYLVPVYNALWPRTRWQAEAVRIRYDAGYGTTADKVPDAIRHAALLLIGHFYEHREEVVSDGHPVVMPTASDALLSPFRIWI